MSKKIRKLTAMLLAVTLMMPVGAIHAAGGAASSTEGTNSGTVKSALDTSAVKADFAGHWAEQDFRTWAQKGLITGYGNGSYKPDQQITRGELITLINRVFNFRAESGQSFKDLPETSALYQEVQKGLAAGYVTGYNDGTIRTGDPVTRQEAAVMLYRAFSLSPSTLSAGSTLKDIAALPDWSRAAVQAMTDQGYVSGYQDNTFRASGLITRAESLRLMNSLSGEILNSKGDYTANSARNVIISTGDVVLADTRIAGNLYLTEGIGEGQVTLNNVTVSGEIRVSGGGENSVVLNNSGTAKLVLHKANGKVRILAEGSSSIGDAQLLSGGKLEEGASLTGEGFGRISINDSLPKDAVIRLSGSFSQVEMRAASAPQIALLKGSIAKLILYHAALLQVDTGSEVKELVLQTSDSIQVKGGGKVTFDPQYASRIAQETAAPSAKPSATAAVSYGGPAAATAEPTPTPVPEASATPLPTAIATPVITEKPPVFTNVSVHDPSIIKDNGTYYVFGSHLGAAKSADLMNWTLIDSGVTPDNKLFKSETSNVKLELAEALEWAQSDTLWAADVIQLADGKFYMYYNACQGSQPLSAMGIAVSDSIEGPYTDKGIFLKSGGANYDATVRPNAVDPDAFFDKDGKLWLVYGSYSGGIFILELDAATGFPIPGQGDGVHLLGQNHSRIEAPNISYDPQTGYYYLYVTFGGLDASGGYNMRVSRSLNPDGPYVDYTGQDMTAAHGPAGSFFDDAAIAPYGVKLFGNFQYTNLNAEADFPVYGYVSAGHNSVYYEQESGKLFNIFHSRFPQRGEAHEVRVQQMFMNEDGWPVVAPHRYAGESIGKVTAGSIAGAYQFINHGKDITPEIKQTVRVDLLEDGTIAGAATGTWELKGDYYAELHINEAAAGGGAETVTYKGVFLRQWDPTRAKTVMTFSAMSGNGVAVWGSQIADLSRQQLVDNAAKLLELGETGKVYSNLVLPSGTEQGAGITWASSDESVVAADGTVKRPEAGQGDATIQLTATLTLGEATAHKVFNITVVQQSEDALADGLVAAYDFEGSLEEVQNRTAPGSVTGRLLDTDGGNIGYGEGKSSQAAVFDGQSGIQLADGLIQGNEYTVAMWLNPQQLSVYTTAFFGASSTEDWISLVPGGTGALAETLLWFSSSSASTGMKLPLNKWSHVAFTYNKGTVTVYVNGVQKFTGTGFKDVFSGAKGRFALGVNYWDTPYKGKLDELRIYEKALPAEMIGWLVNGQPDLKVKVSSIELGISAKRLAAGRSYTPEVEILPGNAGNKELKWSSSHAAAAAVDEQSGVVTAVAPGEAVITAVAADGGGATASYTVTVTDGMVAHYTFDGSLKDSLGRVAGGTVTGAKLDSSTSGTITYDSGVLSQAAVFDGASGVRLPDGLIDSGEYSVSMWLNPARLNKYTTTFFGMKNSDSWISFLPLGGTNKTMLWSGTAWYDAATSLTLATGQWAHVAFTVENGAVKVYVNGIQEYAGTSFPNVFTDHQGIFALGVNYWDAAYKGMMDELKIYSKPLSAGEVKADYAAGQVVLLNTAAKSLTAGSTFQLEANTAVTWSTSNSAVATVADGLVSAVAEGTAVITATAAANPSLSATATITVTAADPAFDPAADLVVLLDFNGNVQDSSGNGNSGTVKNSRVQYTNGRKAGDQAAQFLKADASGAFGNIPVALPNNLIAGDQPYTVTAWVYWNGSSESWPQSFSSIYFSDTFVEAGSPLNYYMNLGLTDNNSLFLSTPLIVSGSTLPVHGWAHVALTVDPSGDTILYLNGIEVARYASAVRTTQGFNEHFLGGNFWDQNFNGLMDEFRMYNKALGADQIAELAGM
ncbi:LamG-like jellyroll fold domain-containing protein [Paenibacillus sp. MMS20-IR301]|uniref:LamG-like jellyroll fold domain-containing protein n=1 Tax=Paenibacillus sp. MMS20-IR301 TaxID=2895946 RepID=UPI0028E668AC|nr:LamG-like jellyroll fold domain-containing protein [Paenibacillus sp. MMS20-IR301]WNS40859.1 LamG-like jellyroll fold domain-containing protein [Paenibacillus sp. MMS20-IR301]